MGNTATVCAYIDTCKAICGKDQILFNFSEWDDPILLDNSQRNQITTNNKNKRFSRKSQNGSLGKSSMNDVEQMNKNKNSLFNSNINTNIYIYSTAQNTKINNSSNFNSLPKNNNVNNSNNNNIIVINAYNKNNFQNLNNILEINNKNIINIQENENKSKEKEDEKKGNKLFLEQILKGKENSKKSSKSCSKGYFKMNTPKKNSVRFTKSKSNKNIIKEIKRNYKINIE